MEKKILTNFDLLDTEKGVLKNNYQILIEGNKITEVKKGGKYNKILNITKISKTNNNNRFISPVFKDLEKEIQSNIIDEICIELKKLTEDQLSHLEEKRRVYPVLRCLFVEFEDYADHVYSLLVGTPSGIYLKKMIEHSKSRSI